MGAETIALNSVWLGIDAAWNESDVLIQTDPIFLVVENLFCLFFVIELSVRFAAYQKKISAFRDWEWVIDLATRHWNCSVGMAEVSEKVVKDRVRC